MISPALSASLVAALLAASPLAARAGVPLAYRCEARGGAAWREYRSAHFVVDTEVSRAKAEALLGDLERMQHLVVQAMVGESVEIPGRVRVIAFAGPEQLRELAGSSHVTGFFAIGRLDEPTIVLSVDGLRASPEVIAHELVHHLSWFLYPRQPRWFAEGLAQFIETVATTRTESAPATGTHLVRGGRESGGHWAGLAPDSAMWSLKEWTGPVDVKDLLGWDEVRSDGDVPERHHVWSWLLYHYLWNQRSKAFTAFQERLAAAEDPAEAWRAAFPEYDPAKPGALAALEEALDKYRRAGRFVAYQVKAGTVDAAFTDAPLAAADLHALLAGVRLSTDAGGTALRRAELAEALREDPAQPVALYELAALDKASPVAGLRRSVAARPGDWRAWALLGHALGEGDAAEQEGAYRKAVGLATDNAFANVGLAWLLVRTGRAKEALPVANRAVDLAPWDAATVSTLATVAAHLGKCREALVLERRAAALTGTSTASVKKRLAEVQARCAATAPPPGN
jgi:tetratricopeptide (TPR) repeat protein